MYLTNESINEKFNEVMSFRDDCMKLWKETNDQKLKDDYCKMFNLLSCKIDSFLNEMDSILYPEV